MSTLHSIGLRIALYDGAYGQTLRIAARNPKALMFLRSMFESLAENRRQELVLGRDQGAYLENCTGITLLLPREDAKRKIELMAEATGTRIVWSQSAAEWRRACGLVDGLVQYGSGHQYLTEMEPSPMIIELSYRE